MAVTVSGLLVMLIGRSMFISSANVASANIVAASVACANVASANVASANVASANVASANVAAYRLEEEASVAADAPSRLLTMWTVVFPRATLILGPATRPSRSDTSRSTWLALSRDTSAVCSSRRPAAASLLSAGVGVAGETVRDH